MKSGFVELSTTKCIWNTEYSEKKTEKDMSSNRNIENLEILPMNLDKDPINKEKIMKMKPKLRIDDERRKFELTFDIPGFCSDDINVFAGNGRIAIKAVDKTKLNHLHLCKVYKAEYPLPIGVLTETLRKLYKDGTLWIHGEIEAKPSSN